ncbi:MAG: cupin domain-containing protein [Coprobacillus sp.]|nr:cupin domain-containing protein [Coprobacillus sp.]MDY4144848.1 cupin domain-containing protein [Bacilli bacterium]OLA06622.1 MAG: hypothetical protein BHW12_07355 [Coprobacillus sp. 28_7]CCY07137.1 cupin 2 conserved barrel domain protein [Coprobacillus sp. CAG:698]
MIKNINDFEKVKIDNMRGGEGSIFLQKVTPVLDAMKMYAKITIPMGSSIGIHTHEEDEEMIYVLKNKGIIIIDGKESVIEEGMISICKKGRNHSIKNIYEEDLVLLAVVTK